MVGAEVIAYLLEQVRLIIQIPGERNYHIFYELLAGACEEEKKKSFLGDDGAEDKFKWNF